jgi:hypothetical protein
MLTPTFIASALISDEVARVAKVRWLNGIRLREEVAQLAVRMGFTSREIAQVGELLEDLREGEVVYRGGAVVLPDELGNPVGLFGWDSTGAVERLTIRCTNPE